MDTFLLGIGLWMGFCYVIGLLRFLASSESKRPGDALLQWLCSPLNLSVDFTVWAFETAFDIASDD